MPHEQLHPSADFFSDGLFEEALDEYNQIKLHGITAYLGDRLKQAEEELADALREYGAHQKALGDSLVEKAKESEHSMNILRALNKNRRSGAVARHHLILLDTAEDIDDTVKQEGTFWYCRCLMLQEEIKWIGRLSAGDMDSKVANLPALDKGRAKRLLKRTRVGAHLFKFRKYVDEVEMALEGEMDAKTERKLRDHLLKVLHTKPEEFGDASLKEQYNLVLKFYENFILLQESDLSRWDPKEPESLALSVSVMSLIGKDLDLLENTMMLAIEALG